jgi:hypothetical protein
LVTACSEKAGETDGSNECGRKAKNLKHPDVIGFEVTAGAVLPAGSYQVCPYEFVSYILYRAAL